MKFLTVFAWAAVVCGTNASLAPSIVERLIPSFISGHIIKGKEAVPHSAPYIVSLSPKDDGAHSCGGTIIAKDWILTAAHCIATAKGMGAAAGLQKRDDKHEFVQRRVVDFGMKHESYAGNVGPYDIALLHVSEPFEFTRYVQPASLPSQGQITTGNVTLYGWGQTKALLPTAPKTLQTVSTNIVVWEECKERMPPKSPLAESNVCSDSLGSGVSACNGDSGGPLVKEDDGTPSELIGIVSWGYIPCGNNNMPSIYTRVSAYVDWTVKIMNAYYTLF